MSVQPALDQPKLDQGDELDHEVCCLDDDIALCGADVSGLPWTEGDSPNDCVVCIDLADNSTHCPKRGVCIEFEHAGMGDYFEGMGDR